MENWRGYCQPARFVRENIILAVIDRLPTDFEYMSFKTKAKIFFKGLLHPKFSEMPPGTVVLI